MSSLRQLTELLSLARVLGRSRGGIHIVVGGAPGDWIIEKLRARVLSGLELVLIDGLEALGPVRVPGHILVVRLSSPATEGRSIARALNLHREELVGDRLHTILLLPDEEAHVELQEVAPDLWSFRHRSYSLADEPMELERDRERRDRLAAVLVERVCAVSGAPHGVSTALVDEIMARVGAEALWEHLGLWRDDGQQLGRLDPLVHYLCTDEVSLPTGLGEWQEELDRLRNRFRVGMSEGRASIELPSPDWSAEPAPGGDEAIAAVVMVLDRVGVAWITGGTSGAAAALASGAGLVLHGGYDVVITLDGRGGLEATVDGWLAAAESSTRSTTLRQHLEQVGAITGSREVLFIIREAELEDVDTLRSVLPSAKVIATSMTVEVRTHWSGAEGLVVGSRAVGLAQRLGIGPEQRTRLDKMGARLRSVGEFLAEAIEPIAKLGESELVRIVSEGSRWTAAVAVGIKEAVPWAELVGMVAPPIKLLSAIVNHATKVPDLEVLAYLVWSNAYQRSVAQAVTLLADRAVGYESSKELGAKVEWALGQLAKPEEPTVVAPTLKGVLTQPFIRHADELLDAYARAAGFRDEERRVLVQQVHERFRWNLMLTLLHGEFREKFVPLVTSLDLGEGEELQARDILQRHADYHRALFEEARVLRQEPFSLAHVYVPSDCGVLTWGECRDRKLDPFGESGGHRPLLDEVLRRIQDPDFKDVIIIQGVAGSGKSTFTLCLCAELIRAGLLPIRVRLRDIDLHQHAEHAIPAQVLYEDDDGQERRAREPERLFRGLDLFDESATVSFGEAMICPYVLILDGWDELETTGDQRLRERIPRFIEEVRESFIRQRRTLVRVVLTGRPWSEVTRSDAGFLGADTPILTIRPWDPDQLGQFFTKVGHCVDVAPLGWPEGVPRWWVVDAQKLTQAKAQYTMSRARARESERTADSRAALEILGSPLLAHLTVRLLSRGGDDVDVLLSDATQLYRRLVDQTCYDGGRAPSAAGKVKHDPAFNGARLRTLLHITAMAMTIEERERISYEVLAQRIRDLQELHPFEDEELSRLVGRATDEFPVAELLIAFFFKGGRRDLGCEFAHKSFREYLFAEALVEVLKTAAEELSARSRKRTEWWVDFSEHDPRYRFIRRLGPALAAQWMTPDVVAHVESLLQWEMSRADDRVGEARCEVIVPSVSIEGWSRIRDALADLWEWWAEGIHLRSLVKKGRRGDLEEAIPYAVELARWIYPADWRTQKQLPAPVRTVTIDAHLGDALCRLAAWVHAFVAHVRGVPGTRGPWKQVESHNGYQCRFEAGGVAWTRFRPGGGQRGYLQNFIGRINGAGWRHRGRFPSHVDLGDVDARGVDLSGANLGRAYLERADLSHARLSGADLRNVGLGHADLGHADLSHANLIDANLGGADLSGANLSSADLRGANLSGANLSNAHLRGADLIYADLIGANLNGADLIGADLIGAHLSGADLSGAHLSGADLSGAHLSGVTGLVTKQIANCRGVDDAILDESLHKAIREMIGN
ncbi:MAG: pentapeptide repeat-containing protein [Myxococcota bacterium]